MKYTTFLFLAVIFVLLPKPAAAQSSSEPPRYTMYAYMKVKPGMEEEYLKLEKAWKKIHAASKKAGHLDDWSLSRLMFPGTANEYDYVARNAFVGNAQLSNYLEGTFDWGDWSKLLTKEELDLVNRTNEIRDMVKTELWYQMERVLADDINKTAKIAVFNYFKSAEGKTPQDHINMEKDIWIPVHSARVKDGIMKGWVLLGLAQPFGSSLPYDMATIDVYTDMKQYTTPWFEDYFKKVHPGKNMDDLMKRTSDASSLVKGEVRVIVDRLDW